jgi:DNA-directed RNA polymerase specialized sigma24 family protein
MPMCNLVPASDSFSVCPSNVIVFTPLAYAFVNELPNALLFCELRENCQLCRAPQPLETWEAFCRVTFDGQTPQEVAAALSISVNVVYLARSRVLCRLRKEIRGLLD